jgi:Transglutaminase-like superfamily/GYF domain 2
MFIFGPAMVITILAAPSSNPRSALVRLYYARDDKQRHGPFTVAELKQLAARGDLLPTDRIVREGGGNWTVAGSVKGLFSERPIAEVKSPPPQQTSKTAQPRPRPVEKGKPSTAPTSRTTLWIFGFSIISSLGLAGYLAWQGETLRQQLDTTARELRARTKATETAAHDLTATRKELKQAAEETRDLRGKTAEAEKRAQAEEAEQKGTKQAIERMRIELAAGKENRDELAKQRKVSKDLLDAAEERFEEMFGVIREERKGRKEDKPGEEGAANKRLKLLLSEPLATYAIDRYAVKAPPEAEVTPKTLAKYLSEPARNDRDRVRAVYRWMTDRIAYDADAFFAKRRSAETSDDILKRRKCVCAGYAQMFDDLCKRMGVQTAIVGGYARGIEDDKEVGDNHAWNAVKLDGKWYLVDVTWGAGCIEGKRFSKCFNDVYFLTPPEQMIFTHLPTDPKWQLSERPVTAKEFEMLKGLGSVKDVHLFPGMSEEFRRKLDDGQFRGFVKVTSNPALQMLFHKAPVQRHLIAGANYDFKIEASSLTDMALKNGEKWTTLKRNDTIFEGSLRPEAGRLEVLGHVPNRGMDVWVLMEYVVE